MLSDHRSIIVKIINKDTEKHPTAITKNSGWYINKEKLSDFVKKVKELISKYCIDTKLTPSLCEKIITEASDVIFVKKSLTTPRTPLYWWSKEIGKIRKNCQQLRRKIIELRRKKLPLLHRPATVHRGHFTARHFTADSPPRDLTPLRPYTATLFHRHNARQCRKENGKGSKQRWMTLVYLSGLRENPRDAKGLQNDLS